MGYEIRKVFVQSKKSLAVVIPSELVRKLGLEDGDYVRIVEKGGRLILEKINDGVEG